MERKRLHTVLVGKPDGKEWLGRPRRRWEGNIKMNFIETGQEDMDWIHLKLERDKWRAI